MREHMRIGSLVRGAAYFVAPAVVLGAIWFAVIKHYHVASPTITKNMIELGRQLPSDILLDELSSVRFFDDENRLYSVETAEKLLQGELALPGEAPGRVHLPFDPQDIDGGSPYWQLSQARLLIPRILLAAYRMTKREEFFLMARDVILGWASYERRAVLPKGELWGDHAIAERILALAEFWSVYRHHPSYNADVAETIFVFAARGGHFLADPTRFTVSSNHGVMQNLGLWHLSLAFPSMPESQHYAQLAFERLGTQMGFYINEEGFVLEHSAGYQKTGVQFMSMAFRYMTLLGIEVPDEWRHKYEKAKEVYAQLRRPDGSLPMFGDTEGGANLPGPLIPLSDHGDLYGPLMRRAESVQPQSVLYPIAGYSIWWHGSGRLPTTQDLSQTVVAWSYFPGHAHKHADEMSVLLWAGGQTWWTNVGYWPYGTGERGEAESWNGSNAPHLTGESVSSMRTTRMLGEGRVDRLSFVDLERSGQQGYVARRQVAQAMIGLWVVLDHTQGDVRDRTETLWTTSHDIQLTEGRIAGSYDLGHPSNKSVLRTFIFGSSGTSIRRYKGNQVPFAGWQMTAEEPFEAIPKPASAIMVEQPANDSWAVTIWSLDSTGSRRKMVTAMPSMDSWKGPENWTITLPTESGTIRLSREADKVSFGDGGVMPSTQLTLARSAGVDQKIVDLHAATERAIREYRKPKFQDAIDYRFKATYFSLFLLVLQEAFFAIYRRITSKRYVLLRGLSAIAWVGVGIWLVVIRYRLV